jgi:hypothetical protein
MAEYLGSNAVAELAESTIEDVSRTSYTISSGIVGSSLKRPRTLLEGPVLTSPRFLLEAALILFVGRSSGGKGGGRTGKKRCKKPYSQRACS